MSTSPAANPHAFRTPTKKVYSQAFTARVDAIAKQADLIAAHGATPDGYRAHWAHPLRWFISDANDLHELARTATVFAKTADDWLVAAQMMGLYAGRNACEAVADMLAIFAGARAVTEPDA